MASRSESRVSFLRWWDIPLAGFAVVLAVVGVDVLLSFQWTPRSVAIPDGEAFHYPWRVVWLVAFAGGLLIAIGFLIGTERQFYNWLFVAVGVGLLTLGTSYVALERVAITSSNFSTERWWGIESRTRNYDELESVTMVTHQGKKGAYWIAVRCEQKGINGAGPVEEFEAPRLMQACYLPLRQHAMAKGVAVHTLIAPP